MSGAHHHRGLFQYLRGSPSTLPSSSKTRRCPEVLVESPSENRISPDLDFPGRVGMRLICLAVSVRQSLLGWFPGSGTLGLSSHGSGKRDRVKPPRVCCSVRHEEEVESAPYRVRLTCQHLLHQMCLEYMVRHCSREAGPRCPPCRKVMEEDLPDQRDNFTITKVIDHKV